MQAVLDLIPEGGGDEGFLDGLGEQAAVAHAVELQAEGGKRMKASFYVLGNKVSAGGRFLN